MKQMKCAQLGGLENCEFIITGRSPDEMLQNGLFHMANAHPEVAKRMESLSAKEKENWMREFRPKFEAASKI